MLETLDRTRGFRPAPTARERERLALTAATERFAGGRTRFRTQLERGALTVGATELGWRFALFNEQSDRIAVGSASGDCLGGGLARTVAELLRRAPAREGAPCLAPHLVGEQMLMRGDSPAPCLRSDGTVRMTVADAEIVIAESWLQASSLTSDVWLSLEGRWTTAAAAKVADALLRDLAPAARHLTYTTEPRGHHRTKSGSWMYGGSSTALCSCGWACPAGDRPAARGVAAWHRDNPELYHAVRD
jgi:hypothetical protein